MVALTPINELKKQREELLDILKTKHTELYEWMKENNIDPLNLKMHSASLATALVVATAIYSPSPEIPDLIPQVQVIDVSELRGKTNEEKAELVWDRYGGIIKRAANKYDVDENLIFATIMLESGGDTNAIRHEPQIGDASYGLGQILYGTAKGIGYEGTPEGLYDPEVNIELIARYHRRNLDVYGDLTPVQLTTAYNAGSPYSTPLAGHINKFQAWYDSVEGLKG